MDKDNGINIQASKEKLEKIIEEQRVIIRSAQADRKASAEIQRQPDELDVIQENVTQQVSIALMNKASSTIEACQNAIGYMRRGEFGYCRSCWDDIESSRLEKTPYLFLCSSCSQDSELLRRSHKQSSMHL